MRPQGAAAVGDPPTDASIVPAMLITARNASLIALASC